MKTKTFFSEMVISNLAVTLLFVLIFLGGALMAQVTISRDYWYPGDQRVCLVKFTDSIGADSAIQHLRQLKLKPVTLDELMTFNISTYGTSTYDGIPSRKIVALGSRWGGMTGLDYIPYSSENVIHTHCAECLLWDSSFVFLAFRNPKDKMSFETLEHYFKYMSEIPDENEDPDLFVSDEYNVVMYQKYHHSVEVSDYTGMNEFVTWKITYKGQTIRIADVLSYQSILNPKVINDNLVFKAVDRGGEHGFYTVIPLQEGMYKGDAYVVSIPKK